MTKVWCGNSASFTIRSILALPVKWGTSNLPPLIASTLGSVDQTKCLTPASLAARTAAVACLRSSVPGSRKLVTRKTPCASSNAALRVSGRFKSASTTSSASSRCLSGLRVKARTLNWPLACRARKTPPPCCPVAPITAINFLLLDDMLIPRFFVSISLSQLLSCNALLEKTGESGTDAEEHNYPQHRHDESQRQTARKHQYVNEQNIDDDGSQQRQREWDVAVEQEQDRRNNLEQKYRDQIMGDKEGPDELAGRSGRRRTGNEVEEAVQSKDEKDETKKKTGDDSNDFHGSLVCLIHSILTSIQSVSS